MPRAIAVFQKCANDVYTKSFEFFVEHAGKPPKIAILPVKMIKPGDNCISGYRLGESNPVFLGNTEIAERGRSVLVMRARYRSAGLTPHQRGWTDAG